LADKQKVFSSKKLLFAAVREISLRGLLRGCCPQRLLSLRRVPLGLVAQVHGYLLISRLTVAFFVFCWSDSTPAASWGRHRLQCSLKALASPVIIILDSHRLVHRSISTMLHLDYWAHFFLCQLYLSVLQLNQRLWRLHGLHQMLLVFRETVGASIVESFEEW